MGLGLGVHGGGGAPRAIDWFDLMNPELSTSLRVPGQRILAVGFCLSLKHNNWPPVDTTASEISELP